RKCRLDPSKYDWESGRIFQAEIAVQKAQNAPQPKPEISHKMSKGQKLAYLHRKRSPGGWQQSLEKIGKIFWYRKNKMSDQRNGQKPANQYIGHSIKME